jgi:hypothetical protein
MLILNGSSSVSSEAPYWFIHVSWWCNKFQTNSTGNPVHNKCWRIPTVVAIYQTLRTYWIFGILGGSILELFLGLLCFCKDLIGRQHTGCVPWSVMFLREFHSETAYRQCSLVCYVFARISLRDSILAVFLGLLCVCENFIWRQHTGCVPWSVMFLREFHWETAYWQCSLVCYVLREFHCNTAYWQCSLVCYVLRVFHFETDYWHCYLFCYFFARISLGDSLLAVFLGLFCFCENFIGIQHTGSVSWFVMFLREFPWETAYWQCTLVCYGFARISLGESILAVFVGLLYFCKDLIGRQHARSVPWSVMFLQGLRKAWGHAVA